MIAFDEQFPHLAGEQRAIQRVAPSAAPVTFLFAEYFCEVARCDCRRVQVLVMRMDRGELVASIHYGFDAREVELDPEGPQGAQAEEMFDVFVQLLADPAYRASLERHYALCKRGPRARPRRKQPAAAPGLQELARVVAKAANADGKLQQKFRRLLAKVDRVRAQVQAWRDRRPDIDRELAAVRALYAQRLRHCRELITRLDALAQAPAIKLTRRERAALTAMVVELAVELLETGEHDDVKPIYNRYARSDYDAEIAADEAIGIRSLKALMEDAGFDVGDADVRTMDELRELGRAQLEEAEREAAARKAKRKKSARQLAAEARKADEQRDAHKAVQEVYRTLAKELHPDREPDPEERARKTALMSEVNGAYAAKDLLRLLELQLQHERVDADGIDAVAEERVRHYIRVLEAQAKQLAAELEELELPFRMQIPSARVTAEDAIAGVRADAARLEADLEAMARDLRACQDEPGLRAWLKAQTRVRRDDPRAAAPYGA